MSFKIGETMINEDKEYYWEYLIEHWHDKKTPKTYISNLSNEDLYEGDLTYEWIGEEIAVENHADMDYADSMTINVRPKGTTKWVKVEVTVDQTIEFNASIVDEED